MLTGGHKRQTEYQELSGSTENRNHCTSPTNHQLSAVLASAIRRGTEKDDRTDESTREKSCPDYDLSLWERSKQVGRLYAYIILKIVWKKQNWIFTKHPRYIHAQNTSWAFALWLSAYS